jgi:hypothetical protein
MKRAGWRQPPAEREAGEQHDGEPGFEGLERLEIGAAPFDQLLHRKAHPHEPERQQQPNKAVRGEEGRPERESAKKGPAACRAPPDAPVRREQNGLCGQYHGKPEPQDIAPVQIGPQHHQ